MNSGRLIAERPIPLYRDADFGTTPIALLPAGSVIHIQQGLDDWYAVIVGDLAGYVPREALEPMAGSWGDDGTARGGPDDTLLPLEPPPALHFAPRPEWPASQRAVATAWDQYGGLLNAIAAELELSPAVVTAVVAVEAGGRAFADDGRMIIRFEAHIFDDLWGKQDPARFSQHFRYDATQRWTGHAWRASADQPWQPYHGVQEREWQVFSFARTLNERAAMQATSMGIAQIMGFNHFDIGYPDVQEMFEAFAADVRGQIRGFFAFLRGRSGNSGRVQALRAGALSEFVRLYNGANNVARYTATLSDHLAAFEALWASQRCTVTSVGLNLRRAPAYTVPNVIRVLARGDEVALLPDAPFRDDESITWVKVRAGGDAGWVSAAYLEAVFE